MFSIALLIITVALTWYLWNDDNDDNTPRLA